MTLSLPFQASRASGLQTLSRASSPSETSGFSGTGIRTGAEPSPGPMARFLVQASQKKRDRDDEVTQGAGEAREGGPFSGSSPSQVSRSYRPDMIC